MNEFQHMNIKYKTVDTRTEKGLKQVERLKANGWKVGSIGKTVIELYKPIPKNGEYSYSA
jgi:hypothetical protein